MHPYGYAAFLSAKAQELRCREGYGWPGAEGSSAEDLASFVAVVLGHPWPPRTQDILSKLELRLTLYGYDADGGLSTGSNMR